MGLLQANINKEYFRGLLQANINKEYFSGLLHANVDKGFFLSQHEAAGAMNPEIREAYKEALQGFQGSAETL